MIDKRAAEANDIAGNLTEDDAPANAAAELEVSAEGLAAAAEAIDISSAESDELAASSKTRLDLLETEDDAAAEKSQLVAEEALKLEATTDEALDQVSVDADELERRVAAFEAELADRPIPPGASSVFVDGNGNLFAIGTGQGDEFLFQANSDGTISVGLNNTKHGPFKAEGRIIAFGFGGDDAFSTAGNLTNQLEFFGGEGDDKMDLNNGPVVIPVDPIPVDPIPVPIDPIIPIPIPEPPIDREPISPIPIPLPVNPFPVNPFPIDLGDVRVDNQLGRVAGPAGEPDDDEVEIDAPAVADLDLDLNMSNSLALFAGGASAVSNFAAPIFCPVNILVGGPGNDTIVGGFSTDIILGLGGNDTLIGGPCSDVLIGGVPTPVAVVTAKAVEAFMHRKLGITVRAVCLPPAIVAHQ